LVAQFLRKTKHEELADQLQ